MSLDLASDSVIMCSMKDLYIDMGKEFNSPMPACQQDMMTSICNAPAEYMNKWTDRLVQCCSEEGNSIRPVCSGDSPGALIEKYLEGVDDRKLTSYGASWGPSFAGVVLALVLATANVFA